MNLDDLRITAAFTEEKRLRGFLIRVLRLAIVYLSVSLGGAIGIMSCGLFASRVFAFDKSRITVLALWVFTALASSLVLLLYIEQKLDSFAESLLLVGIKGTLRISRWRALGILTLYFGLCTVGVIVFGIEGWDGVRIYDLFLLDSVLCLMAGVVPWLSARHRAGEVNPALNFLLALHIVRVEQRGDQRNVL